MTSYFNVVPFCFTFVAVDVAIAMATVQTRVEQMRRRYHFLKYGDEKDKVGEGEKDVDKVEASDEEEGTSL